MTVLRKELKVDLEKYYELHLNILNGILPVKLTSKEITILSSFLMLDKSIVEDDMFNTFARSKVRDKLDNMSASSLSNHLKTLINKGFLNKSKITGRITLKDFLIPDKDGQGYLFKIIVNDREK